MVIEKKYGNYEKILEQYQMFGCPKEYRSIFFENDYPYPFSRNGKIEFLIYPISVDLYYIFHTLVQSLLLSKNDSGDIKTISMSYLDYIIYLAEQGESKYLLLIVELLLICLNLPRKYNQGKDEETIVERASVEIGTQDNKAIIIIQGKKYSAKDFDKLKEIICEQNSIELPDPNIHPDILKAYKDTEEYKRKQSKFKMCSFGDQMNIVLMKTAYKKQDVLEMSIRTFAKLLERIDITLHYEIMTLLSPNMDKKGQQSITHYLSDTTKDKYKESLIDFEQIEQKMI